MQTLQNANRVRYQKVGAQGKMPAAARKRSLENNDNLMQMSKGGVCNHQKRK